MLGAPALRLYSCLLAVPGPPVCCREHCPAPVATALCSLSSRPSCGDGGWRLLRRVGDGSGGDGDTSSDQTFAAIAARRWTPCYAAPHHASPYWAALWVCCVCVCACVRVCVCVCVWRCVPRAWGAHLMATFTGLSAGSVGPLATVETRSELRVGRARSCYCALAVSSRPFGLAGSCVCSARWRGLCAGREMRGRANPFEDHRSLALPSGIARCTPHRSRAFGLLPAPPQCSGQLTRQLHSVAPSGAWVWVGEVSPAGPHAMCTTPLWSPIDPATTGEHDHVHYVILRMRHTDQCRPEGPTSA